MPCLTVDPTKDICPSYDDEDHEFVRVAIITRYVSDPITAKEAITQLQDAWKRSNNKKVAQWNEQLMEDQQAQEEEA